MAHIATQAETGTEPDPLAVLDAHKLAVKLREAAQDVELSRSVFNIAEGPDQAENFTTGILSGPSCFAAKPAILTSRTQRTALAVFYLGKGFTGHKGYAHGGILATIMDECCGRAAVCHYEALQLQDRQANGTGDAASLEKKPLTKSAALTAQLTVEYKAPVPTESFVIVQTVVQMDEGTVRRKAKVAGQLWAVSPDNDREDIVCAAAQALFIEPKV